ncbi:MAG TPA: hypothetical protein VGU71_10225 [Candidatus Dormibacteraeota bacterium]|nr:hypothetical protein [Candidatus Dormibacteraeota bacterium]
MLKKLVLSSGLALAAVAMAIAPALAYIGTPGASCATSSITVVAGGSVTFTSHFIAPAVAGQTVTYTFSGGGPGTTVTFNPASGTIDASGNVTTTATFSANSSGTVTLTATIGAQNCSTGLTATAFPAASSLPLGIPVPFAWMAVLLIGVGLVGAALLAGRRRQGGSV